MAKVPKKLLILTGIVVVIGFVIFASNNKENNTKVNRGLSAQWYLLLLENRLSYVQLSQLNPKDVRFFDEFSQLRSTVRATNINLQEFISTNQPISAKAPSVINRQLALLDTLDSSESVFTQIFQYDAKTDLEELDVETNAAALAERAQSASNALQRVANQISSDTSIAEELTKTTNLLRMFSEELEGQDFEKARVTRTNVVQQFDVLKQAAFEEQLRIIRSDDSISMLVDLTKELVNAKKALETTSIEH